MKPVIDDCQGLLPVGRTGNLGEHQLGEFAIGQPFGRRQAYLVVDVGAGNVREHGLVGDPPGGRPQYLRKQSIVLAAAPVSVVFQARAGDQLPQHALILHPR